MEIPKAQMDELKAYIHQDNADQARIFVDLLRQEDKAMESRLTAKIESSRQETLAAIKESESNILEAHGEVLGDHETRLVVLEQKALA
ncbi:MAG: hypothetical protein WC802_01380 [Patescibacteria group bacterium]|jgi:hypothetical protein